METDEAPEDRVVGRIPIHYSENLAPFIHLHQFQLSTRPLIVPPSAAIAGKAISARCKPAVGKYEIHVPNDVRPEVWNQSRGMHLGAARYDEDREEAAIHDAKFLEKQQNEMRLSETRLLSDSVPHSGAYVLGVMRDNVLHLHPISETHQFNPSLTYLDEISKAQKRQSRRGVAASDDEDDAPPADIDDPAPAPKPKKAKATSATAKEVTTAVRRRPGDQSEDLGGLSTIRRELIAKRRKEREEPWEGVRWYDAETRESSVTFDKLFSKNDDVLECTTRMDTPLKATHITGTPTGP